MHADIIARSNTLLTAILSIYLLALYMPFQLLVCQSPTYLAPKRIKTVSDVYGASLSFVPSALYLRRAPRDNNNA